MQTIKLIPLGNISVIGNYRDVAPPNEKDADIIELSKSIEKDGVMQAILVRPDAKKKDHYQVVFGHRRLIAAKLAKQINIPASIKEVADDDILELQVTENMNRKDVHPMDEAVAYKSLMTKKKWTVAETAARFNKKEDYITQRLKLNDLVPASQKLFKEDKFLLGHALLLSRLTAEDQNEIIKNNKNDFGSVSSLADYINRNIIRDLQKASFDITDAALFPQAGSCIICPKRSGCNASLFSDVKTPDRCFDKNCFSIKSAKAFTNKLQEISETHPEIHLVKDPYSKYPETVKQFVQKNKLKVLVENNDCSDIIPWTGSRFQIKSKGFFLNGMDAGKITTIYLPGKAGSKAAGEPKEDPKTIIAGIQQRTKRSAELDAEKVHARILESMKNHSTQKKVDAKLKSVPEPEHVAMMYILFSELDYNDRDNVVKMFGIKGYHGHSSAKSVKAFYQSFRDLSVGELTYIIRRIMMEKHAGTSSESDEGYIYRKMAESYKDIPIAQYEKEQKEIRNRREARAAERITALSVKQNPVRRGRNKAEVKKINGNKIKLAVKGKQPPPKKK